jgi:uncharacterized protein YbjQ (UPF0145 family)
MEKMRSEAQKRDADGVVGVAVSYQTLSGGELLFVVVEGTAVFLSDPT